MSLLLFLHDTFVIIVSHHYPCVNGITLEENKKENGYEIVN